MTVKEFDKFLRLGLGRCVIELSSCGVKEKYRASVLKACLNNYSYDTQSEGVRAAYVYSLVSLFGDDGYFVEPVISAFLRKSYRDGWIFHHYCELLVEFCKRGSAEAKSAFYRKYAFLYDRLSVKRPKRGYVDDDAEYYEKLCVSLVELYGKSEYLKIQADLNKLYEINANYGKSSFDWFYDCAPSLVGDVTEEADSDYFKKCDRDKRYKPLRQPTAEELGLAAKLSAATDEDERHGIGMDIIDAFEDGADLLFELLDAVYHSRCGCCRYDAVKLMAVRGRLTDELIKECVYDSYEDTREFAKSLIK